MAYDALVILSFLENSLIERHTEDVTVGQNGETQILQNPKPERIEYSPLLLGTMKPLQSYG